MDATGKTLVAVSEKNVVKTDTKYKIIIFILLVTTGVLSWQLLVKTGEWEMLAVEKTDLEVDRQNLREELSTMLANYDSLDASSAQMEEKLDEQKQRIRQMLIEVDKHKDDAYIIMKLRKESESLRVIMKGFVHTIDSLNTLNIALNAENKNIKNEMADVKDENTNLQNETTDLKNIIDYGATLRTHGVLATGIREKATGKVLETLRASRASMIKSCFTIEENRLTKAGDKFAIIRIISPDGKVLINGITEGKTIETKNGEKLTYSAQRKFNYQNQSVRLCVFYKKKDDFIAGEYTSEIYCEGSLIGKTSFTMTR